MVLSQPGPAESRDWSRAVQCLLKAFPAAFCSLLYLLPVPLLCVSVYSLLSSTSSSLILSSQLSLSHVSEKDLESNSGWIDTSKAFTKALSWMLTCHLNAILGCSKVLFFGPP